MQAEDAARGKESEDIEATTLSLHMGRPRYKYCRYSEAKERKNGDQLRDASVTYWGDEKDRQNARPGRDIGHAVIACTLYSKKERKHTSRRCASVSKNSPACIVRFRDHKLSCPPSVRVSSFPVTSLRKGVVFGGGRAPGTTGAERRDTMRYRYFFWRGSLPSHSSTSGSIGAETSVPGVDILQC